MSCFFLWSGMDVDGVPRELDAGALQVVAASKTTKTKKPANAKAAEDSSPEEEGKSNNALKQLLGMKVGSIESPVRT
eukprot:scaffold241803_cov17-Prasinocladus_malaysianus.AAC.1